MSEDPEARRVAELIARIRTGEATDADREELALYTADEPEFSRAVAAADADRELGKGWLVRVEADRRIQRAGNTAAVRAERGMGVALVAGGIVASLAAPAAGAIAMAGGAALLLWSLARVRLRTFKDDPYKDVKQ